jgi:hypothetical protein
MAALTRRQRVSADKNVFCAQIEVADRQLDRLIYELYGLRDGEITRVETTTFAENSGRPSGAGLSADRSERGA